MLMLTCCTNNKEILSTPTLEYVSIENTDKSWLEDTTCKSSCWYGMEIGRTTEEDAINLIKSVKFVDPNPVREYGLGNLLNNDTGSKPNNKGLVFKCIQPKDKECVFLEFKDSILFCIAIKLNYDLHFSDVVTSIGPPDFVQANVLSSGTILGCQVILIWNDRNLHVRSNEFNEETGRNACTEFYKNGFRPFKDMRISEIEIDDGNTIKHFEKHNWNGFSE